MVSTRSSSVRGESFPPPDTPTPAPSTTLTKTRRRAAAAPRGHTPTKWTLLWLAISLPLVTWDTGYIFGRPHTMPGGWAHAPIWSPYALYGRVDYIYGFKAIEDNNGFTAAQAALNVCETALYAFYGWAYLRRSVGGVIPGRLGSWAVLLAFSAAVMTFSKTVLYWAIEAFNGAADIGHNEFWTLLIIWVIPNGAWFVGSGYMIFSMGSEILEALDTGSHSKTA